MNTFERARNRLFWIADYLNGSNIIKHYNDIKSLLENPESQDSQFRSESYISRIIKHATETTAFYSSYKDAKSISDFPVINKTIIKNNKAELISSSYDVNKLFKVKTSGSTGAPLEIYQDKIKRTRHQAENIYFSQAAGYLIGTRLYYLRVWNEINRKSIRQRWQQNIVMVDASNLSDNKILSFLERLKVDKSTKTLLAFSSTFEALSHFLTKHPLSLPSDVNSIITISETLPDAAKLILRKAFSCPVISRYSNMENGFLAQQCIEENNEYHLNEASYYFEILHPERDERVENGIPGRVVVTDLFNFGMPLIRYDTGDIAIMSEKSICGRKGKVFTRVEGRKVDFVLDTRGNLLSPHVVTNTMWKYSSEIKQFQFIQNNRNDYLIKLNCKKDKFIKELELLADLKRYLGTDAFIQVEYVDEIPILASGKRRKIVNNFTQTKSTGDNLLFLGNSDLEQLR